jgi:3',5'-cyclic AMP phosphodiesterase CpdA
VSSAGKIATASGAKTGLWVPTRRELFVGIPSAASQPSQVQVFKEATASGTQPAPVAEAEDISVEGLLSAPGPTFTVAASELPEHWSLIAYGDTRFTDPSNETVTNPFARRVLVARVAELHPDALLISGDLPYDGSNPDDYKVFQQETGAWRDEHLRVYPALGNHELHKDEAREPKNWWAAFPELKERRWYSVAFGNEYLIALDSDLPLTEGSRQQLWLADQLEHLPPKTHFVFLSLHHPPVADSIEGNHSHDVRPNEKALAGFLAKQAASSHAQFIVIAGHIHNYQRFSQDGITYLVSGGGGAKPYPIARTPADLYQDPSFPNYHYVRFDFDGTKVNAAMYRLADPKADKPVWEEKDAFTVPVKQ